MARPGFQHLLAATVALGACLSPLAPASGVHAAASRSGPPAGINPARPTVSGRLVARPGTGNHPVVCKETDRSGQAAAVQNRGLVICTAEGNLVLLELSNGSQLFDRNWDTMTVAQMSDGDHVNAWGTLRGGGTLLSPTVAVRDTSKPRPVRLNRVVGTLVAMPGANGPVVCNDQDRSAAAAALMQNRGLVVCTSEGRLILLELSARTRILTRDRGAATVSNLRDGDHLDAWGVLVNGGAVLNPTKSVRDTDILRAATNSRDFIAAAGPILTLYVLQSDDGGPVTGVVHAVGRADAHITLCGGRSGSWSNLTQGLTVDITHSIFNVRIMSYVDTDTVHIVSC